MYFTFKLFSKDVLPLEANHQLSYIKGDYGVAYAVFECVASEWKTAKTFPTS